VEDGGFLPKLPQIASKNSELEPKITATSATFLGDFLKKLP
jgi:hypothetical protein